jgi:hypothetical protein
MFAAIHRRATNRNVIAVFLALSAITLVSHVLAVQAYRAFASGLDPFNLQYRLTREMVAIQRGAFGPGIGPAYLTFAALDVVWQGLLMTFLALLWAWIMNHSPRPLAGDAWLLFPLLPALLGVAESAGFLVVVFTDSHEPLHDLTGRILTIHRLKFFLRDANVAITLTLGLFALYFRWRGPVAPIEKEPG